MKNFKFFMAALMCMMISTVCRADDKMIPASQLPAAATSFINQHFSGKSITYAAIDRELGKKKYEVMLSDGTKIDFDKKGMWDKVSCKMSEVPAALIPEAIATYVKANFPDVVITKIDKERYGYDVDLSNGLELKFNKAGMLIAMDD